MNPYVRTQTQALIEGSRLLEAYLSTRSDLRAEIEKLRKSIEVQADTDTAGSDRLQHGKMSASLTLQVIDAMKVAVETLAGVSVNQDAPVDESLLVSARYTLGRAMLEVGIDARTEISNHLKGIYIIVDPEATRGRPVTEVAAQSLAGGARVVQLRDKLSDKGPMLDLARELKALCDAHDALFVMNDHADLAHAVDAGVLHVGQTDLPVGDARQILSPNQLIGNSNGTMEEALQSQKDSVDYMAVGAIYSTTTMGKSGRNALGPEMISRVKNTVKQPIVAIGGINRSNIQDVVRAGADSVCVVSAITFADDPKAATEELVHLYESAAR